MVWLSDRVLPRGKLRLEEEARDALHLRLKGEVDFLVLSPLIERQLHWPPYYLLWLYDWLPLHEPSLRASQLKDFL